MLRKTKELKDYKLGALEGEIGKVKEFYFDDQHWTVRYLVADTGGWLTDRQVLISPYALVAVDKVEKVIATEILVASQGAIVKRSARPGTSLNETRGSKARQPVMMQKIGRGAPDQHQRQGVQK